MTKHIHYKEIIAWANGAEIELQASNFEEPPHVIWVDDPYPDWKPQNKYRIKPSKPSIDWSHVHPDYNYMAVDSSSDTSFLYTKKPSRNGACWFSGGGDYPDARGFASYKAGNCDWKDSLVVRPGYEGDE